MYSCIILEGFYRFAAMCKYRTFRTFCGYPSGMVFECVLVIGGKARQELTPLIVASDNV